MEFSIKYPETDYEHAFVAALEDITCGFESARFDSASEYIKSAITHLITGLEEMKEHEIKGL